MGNHSGKPLIPQQVVTAYDPIFGHLPEAERERRVLQLWTATELCALVYETSFISHLHALAQRPYIPTPISVQESGSHTTKANFFLIEFNEFVCLVFRGTFSIQDWEQNLQVRTGTWRSFRGIHQGWSDAVDCSPVGLIDDLLKKMDKELLVTGHSKGGAEAFLFSTTSKCNPVCMTFAQPHVSTEPLNLNQAQQDRFFRFYGDEDFIPRCNEMFGFQMSPAVNIMVSSGSFARTPTTLQFPVCSTRLMFRSYFHHTICPAFKFCSTRHRRSSRQNLPSLWT
ncbi:hypothetical protein BJ742DRAFT_174194 [Cladochytrium replicatum]|nr:hypothetical protein BJ742DRAFT_174194 [Cladochytrium replicatum]